MRNSEKRTIVTSSLARTLTFFLMLALALMATPLLHQFQVAHAQPSLQAHGIGTGNPPTLLRFPLVPSSSNIRQCLPYATGDVTIKRDGLSNSLKLDVSHLFPNAGYTLFITQTPNAPYGLAWYQNKFQTDKQGKGSITLHGIFNSETFSLYPGTTNPMRQYHLGLWFNSPFIPFLIGCESGATSPIITPFNGQQHAGIQVLNTSNFPDNLGPLSFVEP